MNWGRVLAVSVIVLDVIASAGYLWAGDYRRAIYWVSASVLTSAVTF